MKAYLVIAQWPDGTEGLLFPRPGLVPIAETVDQGLEDFNTAMRDLEEMLARPEGQKFLGTTLHLVRFDKEVTVATGRPEQRHAKETTT